MTKEVLYKYLGTNGVIVSPVHLEDIYYVRVLRLIASDGKQLTKNGQVFYQNITIPEDELSEWYEVDR
jgi:hypothetical protein